MPALLRCSSLLPALGCHLGIVWADYFDDYPVLTHSLCFSSTGACVVGLVKLLGFKRSKHKMLPFASSGEVLGVLVDFAQAQKGEECHPRSQQRQPHSLTAVSFSFSLRGSQNSSGPPFFFSWESCKMLMPNFFISGC